MKYTNKNMVSKILRKAVREFYAMSPQAISAEAKRDCLTTDEWYQTVMDHYKVARAGARRDRARVLREAKREETNKKVREANAIRRDTEKKQAAALYAAMNKAAKEEIAKKARIASERRDKRNESARDKGVVNRLVRGIIRRITAPVHDVVFRTYQIQKRANGKYRMYSYDSSASSSIFSSAQFAVGKVFGNNAPKDVKLENDEDQEVYQYMSQAQIEGEILAGLFAACDDYEEGLEHISHIWSGTAFIEIVSNTTHKDDYKAFSNRKVRDSAQVYCPCKSLCYGVDFEAPLMKDALKLIDKKNVDLMIENGACAIESILAMYKQSHDAYYDKESRRDRNTLTFASIFVKIHGFTIESVLIEGVKLDVENIDKDTYNTVNILPTFLNRNGKETTPHESLGSLTIEEYERWFIIWRHGLEIFDNDGVLLHKYCPVENGDKYDTHVKPSIMRVTYWNGHISTYGDQSRAFDHTPRSDDPKIAAPSPYFKLSSGAYEHHEEDYKIASKPEDVWPAIQAMRHQKNIQIIYQGALHPNPKGVSVLESLMLNGIKPRVEVKSGATVTKLRLDNLYNDVTITITSACEVPGFTGVGVDGCAHVYADYANLKKTVSATIINRSNISHYKPTAAEIMFRFISPIPNGSYSGEQVEAVSLNESCGIDFNKQYANIQARLQCLRVIHPWESFHKCVVGETLVDSTLYLVNILTPSPIFCNEIQLIYGNQIARAEAGGVKMRLLSKIETFSLPPTGVREAIESVFGPKNEHIPEILRKSIPNHLAGMTGKRKNMTRRAEVFTHKDDAQMYCKSRGMGRPMPMNEDESLWIVNTSRSTSLTNGFLPIRVDILVEAQLEMLDLDILLRKEGIQPISVATDCTYVHASAEKVKKVLGSMVGTKMGKVKIIPHMIQNALDLKVKRNAKIFVPRNPSIAPKPIMDEEANIVHEWPEIDGLKTLADLTPIEKRIVEGKVVRIPSFITYPDHDKISVVVVPSIIPQGSDTCRVRVAYNRMLEVTYRYAPCISFANPPTLALDVAKPVPVVRFDEVPLQTFLDANTTNAKQTNAHKGTIPSFFEAPKNQTQVFGPREDVVLKPSTFVTAFGGVGKSYQCRRFGKSLFKPKEIIVICPWNSQARGSRNAGMVNSMTIYKALNIDMFGNHVTDRKKVSFSDAKMVILEECMLMTRWQLIALYNLMQKYPNIVWVANGDPHQLKSIGDDATTEQKVAFLKKMFNHHVHIDGDNLRMKDPKHRELIRMVQHDLFVKKLRPMTVVKKYFGDRILTSLAEVKARGIMRAVTYYKSSFRQLNKFIDEYVPKNGAKIYECYGNKYTKGMHLTFKGKGSVKPLNPEKADGGDTKMRANYEYEIIDPSPSDSFVLEDVDSGLQYSVPHLSIAKNFSLPYANTVHSSQGAEIPVSFVIADMTDETPVDWVYTAISRAVSMDDVHFLMLDMRKCDIAAHDMNEMWKIFNTKMGDAKRTDSARGFVVDDANYVTVKWCMAEFTKPHGIFCPDCLEDMSYTTGGINQVTIDRLNNSIPHTMGNCRLCCKSCNNSKKNKNI